MARPKLTNEQRETLLMWLAADYDTRLIRKWFDDREWPQLDDAMFTYYRKQAGIEIEQLRAARRESALNTGLALKEERVARLKQHADELDGIKWLPDKNGRLWNEAAWRETLDEIAQEMGHRKKAVEHSGPDGGPINITSEARRASAEELAAWRKSQIDALSSGPTALATQPISPVTTDT